MDQIYTDLKKFGRVKLNEPLARHTTFKIGGPARYFVVVGETEKLAGLLNYLNAGGHEYFVLGGGSNILAGDSAYDGVAVNIATDKQPEVELSESGGAIEAEAGVLLGAIVNLAVKNGLGGLEWAIGIPGTVGGAVRGNAGAVGKDTGHIVESVLVWRGGEILELKKNECGFGYRESAFKRNKDVVLRARFALTRGDKQQIITQMQNNAKQRSGWIVPYPSAGSFFKNMKLADWTGRAEDLPELFRQRGTLPAGWLIEQIGGRGKSVGGAKIMERHGNFLINYDNATQSDVLRLVDELKESVYNKFGIELVPEVEILKY